MEYNFTPLANMIDFTPGLF